MVNIGVCAYFLVDQWQKMKSAGMMLWIVTMLSLGGWVAIMAFDRDPPYLYLGAEAGSRIEPSPASPGQMVSTDWKLKEVHKDCPRTIERVFSDRTTGKVITTLDATPLSRVVKTSETSLSRSFNLPPKLPPQTDYHVIARFECNVLQWWFPIEITSPKLPIDIIP
jgi:hypothetical protein